MNDEQSQLPPPDDMLPVPAKKRKPARELTTKEADRALKKFGAKYLKSSAMTGISDFGKFIMGKGTDATAVGFMTFAADSVMRNIQNCDALMEQIKDPELKVRLTESKLKSAETLGKIAKDIATVGPKEDVDGTNNKPVVPIFAPNVVVGVNTVAPLGEKNVSS